MRFLEIFLIPTYKISVRDLFLSLTLRNIFITKYFTHYPDYVVTIHRMHGELTLTHYPSDSSHLS